MTKHYVLDDFGTITADFFIHYEDHGLSWNTYRVDVAGECSFMVTISADENQNSELLWALFNMGYDL